MKWPFQLALVVLTVWKVCSGGILEKRQVSNISPSLSLSFSLQMSLRHLLHGAVKETTCCFFLLPELPPRNYCFSRLSLMVLSLCPLLPETRRLMTGFPAHLFPPSPRIHFHFCIFSLEANRRNQINLHNSTSQWPVDHSQFEDQQLENARKLAKVQSWLGAGRSENVFGGLCSYFTRL